MTLNAEILDERDKKRDVFSLTLKMTWLSQLSRKGHVEGSRVPPKLDVDRSSHVCFFLQQPEIA